MYVSMLTCFFVFNDSATTTIYTDGHTLSPHAALPICTTASRTAPRPARSIQCLVANMKAPPPRPNSRRDDVLGGRHRGVRVRVDALQLHQPADRKSTRLNSSH